MGAVGVPPINPTNGAASWSGTNTVNGQTVNVTVECVNDPAVDVYDFLLMQNLGDYKPLPRLSDKPAEPAPNPEPTPAPTPQPEPTPTDIHIDTISLYGGAANVITGFVKWSNGEKEFIEKSQWINPEVQIIDGKPMKCLRLLPVGATRSILMGPFKK